MPPKTTTSCNWVKSIVTESTIDDFVKTGYLPEKDVMSYRPPKLTEEKPEPKDGEVIIFTDHMNRGFSPPDSKFLRDVLCFSTSILKTPDPILCETYATFKCSVRCTLKKSPPWNFSENTFT